MQILARLTATVTPVLKEGVFQQTEVVGFRTEVADVFPLIARFADRHVHFRAGIAMEAVAFHLSGTQV